MSPFTNTLCLPESASLIVGAVHPVQVRWMVRRDLPSVAAIERASFDYPWHEDDFLRCLHQRNCVGMVAEQAGEIVGMMMYETPRNRLHLLNLAVHPDYRRCGIGRQIVAKLQTKLVSQQRVKMTLEVRETNLAAQLFFRAMGFRAVAVLKDFYDDSNDDAYLMQYRVATPRTAAVQPQRQAG
ncbi:MAG: ribosomal protein S18-alanine N-acetyltransferase [Thermoguttaceae bacterium]